MNDIFRVARVDARVEPFHWAWAEANGEAIEANWRRRVAETPAIFNGRVLLVSDTRHEGDTLRVRFFEAGYADLLAFIDTGLPDPAVENGFAMGALQGRDGDYLLGVMGPRTANSGHMYFPAGTPDLSDVGPDGAVDLASSILREIEEETGLEPAACGLAGTWTVVRHDRRLAFMRDVRLDLTAREAIQRIRAHLAKEANPELADIRAVAGEGDIDETRIPAYLRFYLRWAFNQPQR